MKQTFVTQSSWTQIKVVPVSKSSQHQEILLQSTSSRRLEQRLERLEQVGQRCGSRNDKLFQEKVGQ